MRKANRHKQLGYTFTRSPPPTTPVVESFTRKEIEDFKNMPKEQLAAALFPSAQPSAPHEQTPAWARHPGSTPRAHAAW